MSKAEASSFERYRIGPKATHATGLQQCIDSLIDIMRDEYIDESVENLMRGHLFVQVLP